jgi:UDP-N-acetylglucosamine 2-epimerase (non-hydrolysing)
MLCTIGTRPEAIKMAPVIRAFQQVKWARCRVLLTGQHRDLVDPILEFFGIRPDFDLDIMRPNQSLAELTSRLVTAVHDVLASEQPEIVLAQGDTTTVLATALASFYLKVPFAHVEAGLRTHQLFAPFPEEANRVIAGHLSTLHFVPTARARDNLLREGINPQSVHVTGNTVIDALFMTAGRELPIGVDLDPRKRLVLITAHRRDSFGHPIQQICKAVQELHGLFPDVEFLWPVHPNPAIRTVVERMMRQHERVILCAPLAYGPFVSAMKRATLILTDSGGIQEEAPALGKPVLVMRSESERPEAIECEVAKLVGHNRRTIVSETAKLLRGPEAFRSMASGASPYGDGHAAQRIVSIVRSFLQTSRSHRAAG